MIKIKEQKSIKTIGDTSLCITFEFNPEIIRVLKNAGDALWHKTLKVWELPINKLSFLIDNLSQIDDIDLELLPDKEKETYNLKVNYKTKPFSYQLEGIQWMLNNPNCLLLDPPGLGKTLQVIYLAEELKAAGEAKKCLIICGINSLKTNWEKEIQRHSTLDCVIIGKKITKRCTVKYASIKERAEQLYNPIKEFFVILNIESLRDSLVLDAIKDSANEFDLIVLDEIHKCKAPQSSQGKNLLKLKNIGKRHIGLTGTLLVNDPLDAYVPLKFIGKENSTYTNFKNFYCIIEQKFGHYQIAGFKNMDILKEEIASCSLRRSKNLLKLPPKVIIPEYLEMSEKQSKFYEDLEAGVITEADRVNIKTTSLLGLVTRLRQAATCPSVLTSSDIDCVKIDRAISLTEEIVSSGEKVIIFSTFKEPLYQLNDLLKEYKPLLCTGDQPDEEVSKNIDIFQEDTTRKVILCTTSKMGTGITLTAASYEIFLDSTWTSALEEQCEDRAWRIGSTKSVFIYKLVAKNTIDERIQNILDRKKNISDYIIDDKVNNEEELRELLGFNI
jgi:SNF2 family DNA or RNA helicase